MSDERTQKKKPRRYLPNHLLKQARLERDLRPRELAEQIKLGDPKTIGRWERGEAFPSSIFCQRLCKILQKDAEALGLSRKQSVDDVLSVEQPPEDPSIVDEQKTEEGDEQSIPMPAATSETAEPVRLRDELITDPSLRSDAAQKPFMLPMGDLPLMHQYRHRMIEEVHSMSGTQSPKGDGLGVQPKRVFCKPTCPDSAK